MASYAKLPVRRSAVPYFVFTVIEYVSKSAMLSPSFNVVPMSFIDLMRVPSPKFTPRVAISPSMFSTVPSSSSGRMTLIAISSMVRVLPLRYRSRHCWPGPPRSRVASSSGTRSEFTVPLTTSPWVDRVPMMFTIWAFTCAAIKSCSAVRLCATTAFAVTCGATTSTLAVTLLAPIVSTVAETAVNVCCATIASAVTAPPVIVAPAIVSAVTLLHAASVTTSAGAATALPAVTVSAARLLATVTLSSNATV